MRAPAALLIFTVLLSVNAYGYFSGEMYYKWWKNPRIAGEMSLTEKQVEDIENIFTSYKQEILVHQKELRKRESELLSKLREPQCTKEEVLVVTDDIENIKAVLTRIKVEMFLKIKNVLTPAQEDILHDIRARYRERKAQEREQ